MQVLKNFSISRRYKINNPFFKILLFIQLRTL
ncbi:MAG TPA: hypothetical protein DHV15_03700 [Treponema sp.]|uniref:Uncharacterized protein n=1 Tax=Treponema denticola (strain ATCC 35405 / DSM 14222 / CIP 103919 / JCM 8153 / KCTC 15104) TaxID=243275 RepID=Q73NX1_TREDE|nr:hypothetical protein TDE_1031 [Treponema denticola ATCC 35405]HCY94604.1 hypothetical protein [Treponema sp.]